MSVSEASRIAVDFRQARFDPPPTNTEDVLAILDRYRMPPQDRVWHRNVLASSPPRTRGRVELAKFYLKRAHSARHLGATGLWIEDCQRAADAASGTEHDYFFLIELSFAQAVSGGPAAALATREKMLKVARAHGYDAMIGSAYLLLALTYIQMGDVRTARTQLDKSLPYYRRARHSDQFGNRWWSDAWEADINLFTGMLLEAEGRLAEAETGLRAGIDAQVRNVAKNRERLRAGHPTITQGGVEDWLAMMRAALAEAIARQGRFAEAEAEMRKALLGMLNWQSSESLSTAIILTRYARVLYDQARFQDAEALARYAAGTFERGNANPEALAYLEVRRVRAAALTGLRRWSDANAVFEGIRTAVDAVPGLAQRISVGAANWGLALVRAGRVREAVAMLDEHVQLSRERLGANAYATAEAQGMLGMALLGAGDRPGALAAFSAAIPILLEPRFAGDTVPAQAWRLNEILEAYIELLYQLRGSPLLQQRGLEADNESFRIAEVARSSMVQHAITAAAARGALESETLGVLARQEQDLSQQLQAVEQALLAQVELPAKLQSPTLIAHLRKRMEDGRRARAALLAEVERLSPAYSELTAPSPATVQTLRGVLRPEEALIAVLVADSASYLWSFRRDGPVRFARAPIGRAVLAAEVARLREALDLSGQTVADIPDFDVARAYRLYLALLDPVHEGWRNASTLIVIPHGALARLPVALLPTDDMPTLGVDSAAMFDRYRSVPWLIRAYAVAQIPSGTALLSLRAVTAPAAAMRQFIGFGDPAFAPPAAGGERAEAVAMQARDVHFRNLRVERVNRTSPNAPAVPVRNSSRLAQLPALPDTRDEIYEIAAALSADPDLDVFLGERATEREAKSGRLAGRRVVAFATHGLMAGQLDGLTQPALALSAPSEPDAVDDGLLTMQEILGLRLDAEWVVLSACNTAAGRDENAEAVSGLGRAFFYAGARALLVTHWAVETTSARTLTTRLFVLQSERLQLSRPQALQATMNALIDGPGRVQAGTGRTLFSYAHPVFWAPFALIGG